MGEVNPNENSPWKVLRDTAIAEGSKPSKTPISLISLVGWYSVVWDSETCMENTGDADEEDSWLQLSSKKLTARDEVIVGKYRWWRKMGTFEGVKRNEGMDENVWLIDGVSWGPLPDMEEEHEDHYEDGEREANGHGLIVLATLDSTGCPFIETIHNGGFKNGQPSYTRILWKKVEGEGKRGHLTEGEAKRILQDGIVDELEMWGDAGDLKDDLEEGEADGEGEEDAEASIDESQKEEASGSKRSAEDEGSDVEGERKAKKAKA